MERQHFVVLIDPVGRGRKTKHPVAGDESAARDGGRGGARANVGRPERDECRRSTVRARGTWAGKRESAEGDGRNRARE